MKIRISIFSLIFAVSTFSFQPARADWNDMYENMKQGLLNTKKSIVDSFDFSDLSPITAWLFGKNALRNFNTIRKTQGFRRKAKFFGFLVDLAGLGVSLATARTKVPTHESVRAFFDNVEVPSVTQKSGDKK